jgi:uncharacterized membrane protein
MVDVITPAPEGNPIVEVLLVICTLAFAITALVYTILEKYLVLIVAMVIFGIFAFMFLVSKGWKR